MDAAMTTVAAALPPQANGTRPRRKDRIRLIASESHAQCRFENTDGSSRLS